MIPTKLPYEHEGVYGTGDVVRSEHTVDAEGNGQLLLTFLFEFKHIAPYELDSILAHIRGAIDEYAFLHGYSSLRRGTIGLVPGSDNDFSIDDINEDDDYGSYEDLE